MHAVNPSINATVTASAGSGKTWLLVSRLLRMLLEGHNPGGILALTFTRKAAAEMQQRLAERLREMAIAPEDRLDKLLAEIHLPANTDTRQRARALYEQHQYCDYPVRAQTFHSFCQDILARFPLEADVPPGFNLIENETGLRKQAIQALLDTAALNKHSERTQHLHQLMQLCGGYNGLKNALDRFMAQRSDWWAYTRGQTNSAGYASQKLLKKLKVDVSRNPCLDFFSASNRQQLETFISLLAKHPTKTNLGTVDTLRRVLDSPITDSSFEIVQNCFLTDKGEPRKAHEDSDALRKKLGANTETFLQATQALLLHIASTVETANRLHTYQLNHMWYHCGEYFLEHYQTLKRELRMLDFADLEWRTYLLLQHADNAHWVQYKLDQRIDHILVDEFQDTNPTQWQLLLPLLQELAAGDPERARSAFLVGDEKQSIYGFRRAKPELQARAADWMHDHLQAQAFPLNDSWRSSPAIIEFVNTLFEQDEFKQYLPDFPQHGTHRKNLPGEVEVFAAIEKEKKEPTELQTALRNPLQQPRSESVNSHYLEGQQVASRIRAMIDNHIAVGEAPNLRAITYDDIFILLRRRSHVADFEKALRDAGIPYIGADRGTLLDCIEISDMQALLDTLITPFDNMALAQVLKSPLFSATDEDLMQLAAFKRNESLWIHRLAELQQELDDTHPLKRAHACIHRWRTLADKIPVHDLLDRIYHESNLLARYDASVPDSIRPRVKANLTRFLEMALELDSGRYPSLTHFLQYIRDLREQHSDQPDEAPMASGEPRVRLMTIHASKGLEAPVVFLVDTINSEQSRDSLSTLVDWPVDYPVPQHMQLLPTGGAKKFDAITESYLQQQRNTQQRELCHLLYVAVTRAKQFLYINGCRPEKKIDLDWHSPALNAIKTLTVNQTKDSSLFRYGVIEKIMPQPVIPTSIPYITLPVPPVSSLATATISPSKSGLNESNNVDEDAQTRGKVIHRALDLLTRAKPFNALQTRQALSSEFSFDSNDTLIDDCLTEAQAVITSEKFSHIFRPDQNTQIRNEISISYKINGKQVSGIIDRMLVSKNNILIIDYKTHRITPDREADLIKTYTSQLKFYSDGIRQAWPQHTVHAALVFTHTRSIQLLDI